MPLFKVITQSNLTLRYGTRPVFRTVVNGLLVDVFRQSSEDDRIFWDWEVATSMTRLLVLTVDDNKSSAEVVLDTSSRFRSDVLVSPDVVLVEEGQIVTESGDQLPTKTKIFTWDGKTYGTALSCSWKDMTTYPERFSFLSSRNSACH